MDAVRERTAEAARRHGGELPKSDLNVRRLRPACTSRHLQRAAFALLAGAMPNPRSRRGAVIDDSEPPWGPLDAKRSLLGALTEIGADLTAAERTALSDDTVGNEDKLLSGLTRFMSLDALMSYYRLYEAGDYNRFVRMLARMIEVDPERVADAKFGEALLLAVRKTRRIVFDRQDALGNGQPELPCLQHLVRRAAGPSF